jgi:hypothetical protein
MAETSFDRIVGLGADRIGGPSDQRPNRIGRDDGTNHQPLSLQWAPGVLHETPTPSPWPAQQASESRTEAELREALQRAIADRQASQACLEAAEQAHQRGMEHRAACERRHASYSGLQAELNEATVEQLRSSRGRPDLSLFEGRISARLQAEMALAAAAESERTLRTELVAATTQLQEQQRLLQLATDRVLNIHRGHLYSEATRLAESAAAHRQIASREQTEWPWAQITEALLLDPMGAALDSFTVPETPRPAPPPPPAYLPQSGVIRVMRPTSEGGGFTEVDEGEFHQRMMKRITPGDGMEALQAEEAARQAARKAAGG